MDPAWKFSEILMFAEMFNISPAQVRRQKQLSTKFCFNVPAFI